MGYTLTKHQTDLQHTDRDGKTYPLYLVTEEGTGRAVGVVGQFPATASHKGIRPHSSTGTVKRWGYGSPGTLRLRTTQWPHRTRGEALDALLREIR